MVVLSQQHPPSVWGLGHTIDFLQLGFIYSFSKTASRNYLDMSVQVCVNECGFPQRPKMPVSLKQALQELVRGPDLSAGNLTLVLSETIHTPRGWTIFLPTHRSFSCKEVSCFFWHSLFLRTWVLCLSESHLYHRKLHSVCVGEPTPNTRSTIVTHGTEL